MSINLFRWALLMPRRVLGLHMQHVAQFNLLGIDHVAERAWLGVAVVVVLVRAYSCVAHINPIPPRARRMPQAILVAANSFL